MFYSDLSDDVDLSESTVDGSRARRDTSSGGSSRLAPRDVTASNIFLKRVLRALDLFALIAGWTSAYHLITVISPTDASDRVPLMVLGIIGIVAALVVMATKRLWLARVCAVRSAEVQGLGQTAVLSALVVLAAGQLGDYGDHDRFALIGAFLSFVLMIVLRGRYAAWLKRARRTGRFARRLVLVGANRQAQHLVRLIGEHPEAGFAVVGVCGPRHETARSAPDVPWLGEYRDAASAVAEVNANGALVVASALEPAELNTTVRALLGTGCHVHMSSALSGISHERLLPLPMAREPMFYLERTSLTRSQLAIKRVTDLILGSVLTLVALPALAILAIAIKLDDGGPVLFKQRRVGHRGKQFTVFKLRTMVTDAEQRLAELTQDNQRTGPLFKAARDPRVTRVGWWLRATSLDELPQLFNVLRGEMSLVGPRPALPDEVAQFDLELRQRGRMMPGITGLWQVEARDNPSFDSYRRLDLYYVENWSIGLDLAILGTTFGAVASRAVHMTTTKTGAS